MPAEKIEKRSGVLIDFVRFRISVDRLQRYSLDATTQINAFGFLMERATIFLELWPIIIMVLWF